MDVAGVSAYFAPMLRKLLALLAICAGLVAVAEPARAAATAVEAVRLTELSGPASTLSVTALHAPAQRPFDRVTRGALSIWQPAPAPRVATVVLRVDRARE